MAAGIEPERQVDAGRHQHDETVEGDLAPHERPVVWEYVAHREPHRIRPAGPPVDRFQAAHDHDRRTLHQEGPIGPDIDPAASRPPSDVSRSGSWGSARPAGPNSTRPASAGSNVE